MKRSLQLPRKPSRSGKTRGAVGAVEDVLRPKLEFKSDTKNSDQELDLWPAATKATGLTSGNRSGQHGPLNRWKRTD